MPRSRRQTCPACGGKKVWRGTQYVHGYAEDVDVECEFCDGTGLVTKEQYRRWEDFKLEEERRLDGTDPFYDMLDRRAEKRAETEKRYDETE